MFSSNITAQVQNEILAQGVPALSPAAGLNKIPSLPPRRNYNMDENDHKPNGWGRSGRPYFSRWLHSDLKNIACFYVYKLFDEIVTMGELK